MFFAIKVLFLKLLIAAGTGWIILSLL